ncbi:uncharacterized protein METZ01_LOCUS177187 [marine metagenome]|uniref:Uncharacterized protein n=1 Tax=marine metagenome TaxID=408172 RepID=A0A382CG52_9ZZZZ
MPTTWKTPNLSIRIQEPTDTIQRDHDNPCTGTNSIGT